MPTDFVRACQAGLVACCLYLAILFAIVCAAVVLRPVVRDMIERFRRRGPFEKSLLICAAALAVLYGGSKPHPVENAGADEGISLVGIDADYDSTNDVTAVEVSFRGGNVTTATPVSVRNAETENWRELAKIGAAVTVDLPTNVLSFAAAGNVATNKYWWVGVDTPAVIIETVGITIERFAATSHTVQIAWTCDDPRAVLFEVQRQRYGAAAWETVCTTGAMSYVYTGFTVGETWAWRVISTYAAEGD